MAQLTLALAKGRTAKESLRLMAKANITFPDFHEKSRKLVFYSEDQSIKMIYVKAVDVTTYVEQGAADIGIVGRDNILEAEADLYELLDLNLGKCRFVIASLKDLQIMKGKKIKVASKYPNVTKKYFSRNGLTAETIKLNGSVELAPIIGMADCILDIVETGNTIKENGLTILDDVEHISTRLVVNKASFATKTDQIQQLIRQLKAVLGGTE
ncbi:ATP phosphoribosyltransferase [Pseudogracilibacillus auburnensis]|uniref:ATP phosphoribosyltransferase n=1 Tax=Pseudogracilibacillus auburnensis TaxID=1494959 RepID=A0A2V3VWH2_9BACI|nr:ATP phosphoribosyltransferase [Pseudogracilibacillus auburnensis]MBO1002350.1 ATP phosphoribosyltransferase [Pseudogracilibacillus auburnensis]PXW86262.1 ATP phosphoribosyltransferase catalytic subunit [Pseudogracilibacillus auburnensis]